MRAFKYAIVNGYRKVVLNSDQRGLIKVLQRRVNFLDDRVYSRGFTDSHDATELAALLLALDIIKDTTTTPAEADKGGTKQ